MVPALPKWTGRPLWLTSGNIGLPKSVLGVDICRKEVTHTNHQLTHGADKVYRRQFQSR